MLKHTLGLGTCLLICLLVNHANVGAEEKGKFKEEPRYKNTTYVPIADEVINRMFALAKVAKDDVVYHLICGDGRVLYRAAGRFGAHGPQRHFHDSGRSGERIALGGKSDPDIRS